MAGDNDAGFQRKGQAGTTVETAFSQLSGRSLRVVSKGQRAMTEANPASKSLEHAILDGMFFATLAFLITWGNGNARGAL